MKRKSRCTLTIAIAALLAGCNPSEVEVGQLILVSVLPLIGVAHLLERIYARLAQPDPRLRANGSVRLLAALVVVTLVALVVGVLSPGWQGFAYAVPVMAITALGYVGYVAIGLAIVHFNRPRNPAVLSIVVPSVITIAAGLILALSGSRSADEMVAHWAMYLLLVPAGLLVGPIVLPFVLLAAPKKRYQEGGDGDAARRQERDSD